VNLQTAQTTPGGTLWRASSRCTRIAQGSSDFLPIEMTPMHVDYVDGGPRV
jgi:hypothetical protein